MSPLNQLLPRRGIADQPCLSRLLARYVHIGRNRSVASFYANFRAPRRTQTIVLPGRRARAGSTRNEAIAAQRARRPPGTSPRR